MTRKIFWQDPYQTCLHTHITQVDGDMVCVAETIFYALSGGQESDHGSIAGRSVLQAARGGVGGLEIFYTLSPSHGLKAGDAVLMEIDWERRYRLMRLHFAAEIVLELAYRALPGVYKGGAHIAADKARIDFEWDTNVAPLLPGLRVEAQAIIDADESIVSAFSDVENERRYWKIEAFSEVPCGGTHLRRTGEIGQLQLKRKNVGKGKERIEISVA